MNGKLVALIIILGALFSGFLLYYLQVYYFYKEIDSLDPKYEIRLLLKDNGAYDRIKVSQFIGIDADSSPLKFRGCFSTDVNNNYLKELYVEAYKPNPLTAPSWFECFNAREIGEAINSGKAIAFISELNVHSGVDRVIAFFNNGKAYAWHQLNEKYTK